MRSNHDPVINARRRAKLFSTLGLVLAVTLSCAATATTFGQDRDESERDRMSDRQRARERGRELFRRSQATPFVRNEEAVLTVFKDVVADASASIVKVMDGQQLLAFGTAISADGYVITKASELTTDFTCELNDGTRVPATVIGIHPSEDVALLKISGHELVPVQWDETGDPEVGSWIVSVGQTDIPLAVGVVSVKARPISPPEGVMGVILSEAVKGAMITEVLPESPAEKAGLQAEDVVINVNGESVENFPALQAIIKKKRPGDIVELTVLRGDDEPKVQLSLLIELGNRLEVDPRNERSRQQNELGGPLSGVREGFSQAIQHDSGIGANECGGPVVGLAGKAIGINIARAGRVNSYVLPVAVLAPLIDDLKTGRFAPSIVHKDRIQKIDDEIALLRKTIDDDLKPSIAEYEAEIEQVEAKEREFKSQLTNPDEPTEEEQKQLDDLEQQRRDVLKKLKPAQFKLSRLGETIEDLQKSRTFLSTGLRD